MNDLHARATCHVYCDVYFLRDYVLLWPHPLIIYDRYSNLCLANIFSCSLRSSKRNFFFFFIIIDKNIVTQDKPAYEINKNEQLGRFLVASRDLQAGEAILSELPFVVGPKASTYPICLTCYSPWPPTEDSQPLCSKCSWPVCSVECEEHSHHKDYECKVYSISKENIQLTQTNLKKNHHQLQHDKNCL